MELAAAWVGWCVSACGGLLGVLGCIGSLWIPLVVGWAVKILYPPLGVGAVVCTGDGGGTGVGGC